MNRRLPRTREELRASLQETELPEDVVSQLVAQARQALLLTTTDAGISEIALGESRLGAAPDLPVGMAWPERPAYPDGALRAAQHRQHAAYLLEASQKTGSWMTQEQGAEFSRNEQLRADAMERPFPLAFFGQFDLATLSKIEGFDAMLPAEGRLLVFYDSWELPEEFCPEAALGWRVIWDRSSAGSLRRASIPKALLTVAGWTTVFKPVPISATPIVTPISPDDRNWDAFDLTDDELYDAYDNWLAQFGKPDKKGGENHQLGGYPRTLQNGLQSRAQLAANGINCGRSDAWDTPEAQALLQGAGEWRLLLQIGVDQSAGMEGPGAFYVIIRDEDLAGRRFERARVTYQCD